MKSYTYYLSSYTSKGYVSFFDETLKNFKKIIVLKNVSSQLRDEIFSTLKIKLYSLNLDFDVILRPGTIGDIAAFIIPELSVTVALEELFSKELPLHSDIIDFAEKPHFDASLNINLTNIKKDIDSLKAKAYVHLKNAKMIHDDLEKLYITNIDFNKANSAVDALASKIFSGVGSMAEHGSEIKRFFGTLHPHTNVNYIDELTHDIQNRIFVEGRPGSGKSTCLKKISSIALEKGYNVEKYYCSLDPDSLDMVIIRELNICMFDCTDPHRKNPVHAGDETFDIYEISKNISVDDIYKEEILYNSNLYGIEVKKAKECLYSAFLCEKKLDKILVENNSTDLGLKVIKMIF